MDIGKKILYFYKHDSFIFFITVLLFIFCCIMSIHMEDNDVLVSIDSIVEKIHGNHESYETSYTKIAVEKEYIDYDWVTDNIKNIRYKDNDKIEHVNIAGTNDTFTLSFDFIGKNLCERILGHNWTDIDRIVFHGDSGMEKEIVGANIPATQFVIKKICTDNKYHISMIFK